nr:efflux RND transporter permease subunit [Pseudomonas bharatica]
MPPWVPSGSVFIPLSQVASLDLQPGPNQISRENGKRLVVVSANVRGRDLGSFVEEASDTLVRTCRSRGYWTTWGGQFEQLQSAASACRCGAVALLLVLTLLFLMFNNLKDGLLVFTGSPSPSPAACWPCGCGIFRCRSRRAWVLSPCRGWRCSTAW